MNNLKKTCFFVSFIFSIAVLQSQDRDHKWAVSIGSGAVIYAEKDFSSVGYRYSPQVPRISIARYVFKNIIIAGSFSTTIDPIKKYSTFDGEMRYDFGTAENVFSPFFFKRLSPYVLVGASIVDAKNIRPTVNFGAGGTFWITQRFGLNAQLIYKYHFSGDSAQPSHVYGSGGIVYNFSRINSRRGPRGF
ncbi:hypothetical protein K8354_00005 [Polaribacter litorisediminis]|uniref:hypothetical protein n=1 Tax=Polaribacter litorisediminis TaxID=1908341 RepID=UPI001CBFC7CA|nr:hypothetical protein [Polaribacter litorisediminis]UAM98248.1 hypothetical protein K8354_00005 [Polaribacter litorisediminis]